MERLNSIEADGQRASIYLFAACLFLLLRDIIEQTDRVIIDEEYPGYAADIKAMLLRMLWRIGKSVDPAVVTFGLVGRSSPAHDLALRVSRRKRPPDQNITSQGLLKASRDSRYAICHQLFAISEKGET
jgi:hypothetical protein